MTIPLSKELQAWSRGYDARMAGLPRDNSKISGPYKESWAEGWDEAEGIEESFVPDFVDDRGAESATAYTIRNSDGEIIDP